MVGKFIIFTPSSTTQFKDAFMEAQKRLMSEGNIVISEGLFDHYEDTEVWGGCQRTP